MIRKAFILILTVGLCFNALAQFDPQVMEGILFEQLNEYREKNKLSNFEISEELNAVAFDQASFILKSGNLSHEQDVDKKKTLEDRIVYYEALYAQAGENIAQIAKGAKIENSEGNRVAASSAELIVAGAIRSWMKDKEAILNLNDPNFLRIGLSVVQNSNEEFILVAVMASAQYQMPDNDKGQFNSFGIDAYDKTACESMGEQFASVPQLFSNAFKVEGNELYFEFNSLKFIEELLSDGGDGIAVDLIDRNQFACSGSNALFPGSIHDGYLLQGIKKGKLSTMNLKAEQGEVKLKIGDLPAFYNQKDFEINGLIIKSGHHCATVPFNQIVTENVRWLELPFLYAVGIEDSIERRSDTTYYEFPLNEMEQRLQDLDLFLNGLDYVYRDLLVEITAAPSESNIDEDALYLSLEKRFEPYKSNDVLLKVETKTDWEGYRAFKEGSYYQLETKDMNEDQELNYLNKTKQTDKELLSALQGLSRVKLSITGTASTKLNIDWTKGNKLYEQLLDLEKYEQALFLQEALLRKALEANQGLDTLLDRDIPQVKSALGLINNQILVQDLKKDNRYGGNAIHTAFLELYLIHPQNPVIAYNYHLALLKYWSASSKRVNDLKKWKKEYDKISKKSINPDAFSRAYLNYWIIAADYYYEKGSFDERKKAFDEMQKWARASNLSAEEMLLVAKYLCHQDQFERAISLLRERVNKENCSSALMYYLLQISNYGFKEVPEEIYVKWMKIAKEQYPKEFCNLFSKKKMGIQALKNPQIKSMYCESCSN